jgi:NitT/TauT family transport system substrate-binding protein
MRMRRIFFTFLIAIGLASAQTSLSLVLGWTPQGPYAPYIVALEQGYFATEGISLKIDRGYGSADSVSKVAMGTYDLGVADFASLIEFAARNPESAPVAIAINHEKAPLALVSLVQAGIDSPADLAGKRIASPPGDASRRLFPLFAQQNDLDPESVRWLNVDPALRESLLLRGQTDLVSGHYYTVLLNLEAIGIDPGQVQALRYADYGVDLYGDVLIANRKLEQNPELLPGVVRALGHGFRETRADPKAAIAQLKKYEPLTDPALELRRLEIAMNEFWPATDECFGWADPERIETQILAVVKAYGLARTPAPAEIFDPEFLGGSGGQCPKD